MTIRDMLVGLIPALSDARDQGVVMDMRLRALEWATGLAKRALAEGYDASDATEALTRLAATDDFEMQQLAFMACIGFCDALLGEVASGCAPAYDPRPETRSAAAIAEEISSTVVRACNVYAIPLASRRAMIDTGGDLVKAVDREIAEGRRVPQDGAIARAVHECVAEVATCPLSRREDEAARTMDAIGRLAA